MVATWIAAVVAVVVGVIAGAVCYRLGMAHRRRVAEAAIGSAEEEARRLINDAIKTAEQKRKETIVEAKDEVFKMKAEADKEIRDRRSELTRQEHRLDQKEESLDKKTEAMEQRDAEVQRKGLLADTRLQEAEDLKRQQMDKLEQVSGMTRDDARALLLGSLENELTHEKALRIAAFEQQEREEQDTLARQILSVAIARCAADHAQEATVSVVPLPNDEMKGRIIGREGRNIRALETATGVDLIIDDTPEAITLSSFDPVRREIARQTLEKLIADGRIHPARIEEMVEKSRREVELIMKKEGERAVLEVGVHGLHPDLVRLIGRLKYRTSYGQNILNHSLEVAFLSGLLAGELGVNVALARRAGLLHDIGKALDHEMEGSHVQLGVEVARKYKENPQIIHAIEAHHGDVEPDTALAFIVMAADAISAARPGARRENLENYIQRLAKLEDICSSFPGVEQTFAVQAGREVRILVRPEQISDDRITIMARDIARKIEGELDYPGQIKVNVIRESRAVEYAK